MNEIKSFVIRYKVRTTVSLKKRYRIEFENGKNLENNVYKKRDIGYTSF